MLGAVLVQEKKSILFTPLLTLAIEENFTLAPRREMTGLQPWFTPMDKETIPIFTLRQA